MSPGSIRKLRKRLKLTQTAAAALVRVNPNMWARWERGESKPRGLHQRKAIAQLSRLTSGKSSGVVSMSRSSQVRRSRASRRQSTGRSLLKYVGTWVGDDLDRCLKLVYAARGMAKS